MGYLLLDTLFLLCPKEKLTILKRKTKKKSKMKSNSRDSLKLTKKKY